MEYHGISWSIMEDHGVSWNQEQCLTGKQDQTPVFRKGVNNVKQYYTAGLTKILQTREGSQLQ